MIDFIELTPEFLLPAVALVILTGSLLGSTAVFVGNKPEAAPGPDPFKRIQHSADWRPARSEGVQTYHAATEPEPRSAIPWLAMVYAGAVAFLGATAAITVYKSPWEPTVTLRHMAATLHCDIADQVGLAPARVGEPGYHVRNDRDRNGTSCEVFTPATAAAEPAPDENLTSAQLAPPEPTDPATVAVDR